MPSIYITGAVPRRYIGKCNHCKRPVAQELSENQKNMVSEGRNVYLAPKINIACPDCKRSCAAELVYGVTEAMSCDARCMGAYGPSCSCACGGENHCAVWSRTRDNIPASALEKYHKDLERREQAAQKKREAQRNQKAEEFNEWAEGYSADISALREYSGDNYFLQDMKDKVLRHEILTDNMLSAMRRTIKQEVEYQQVRDRAIEIAKKSSYQGKVGENLTRKLTITKLRWIADKFTHPTGSNPDPRKPMYTFVDEEMNVYVWFASKALIRDNKSQYGAEDVAKEGDTFTLKFKVKDHKDYEGVKQTVISYVRKV